MRARGIMLETNVPKHTTGLSSADASHTEQGYLSLGRGVLAVGSAIAAATTSSFGVASAFAVCTYFDATGYFSLYLVAQQVGSGVGALIAGSIVDRRGPRYVLSLGVILSSVASAVVLAVPWFALVLLLCLIAGVGSGFCMAAGVAGAASFGRPRDRMRLFGVSSAVWGLSGIGVPLLVVVLLDLGGWRAVFAARAAVPAIGYIVYRMTVRAVPEHPRRRHAPLDVPGLVLLTCAALAVQLVIALPQGKLITLPIALAFALAFWWHIGRIANPVFDRAHVAGSTLLPFHVAGGAAFIAAWGLSAVLPLVLQDGLGTSAGVGALGLTLGAAGWLTGSLLSSGPLGRLPTPLVLYGGFVAQAVILLVGASGVSTFVWGILACAVAVGISGGIANNASLGLASAVIDPGDVGRSLSALQFLRGVASSAGGGLAATLAVTYDPIAALRVSQLGAAAFTVIALALVVRSRRRNGGSSRGARVAQVADELTAEQSAEVDNGHSPSSKPTPR